ncbi:DUF6415 family natural product biosynthesis protein [Streptomyces sp. NPDC004270]
MEPVTSAHGPNVSSPMASRPVVSDMEAGTLGRRRADQQPDVASWLLQAADDPVRARVEWQTRDIALLSCGVHFSALRIPAAIVFAAARSEERARVDDYLAVALLGGPVFTDRQSGWYYCLVPAGQSATWRVPDAVCLGVGSYLGVPHPSIDSGRYPARSFWCVPPDGPEAFCQGHLVAQLVDQGRSLLTATTGPVVRDGRSLDFDLFRQTWTEALELTGGLPHTVPDQAVVERLASRLRGHVELLADEVEAAVEGQPLDTCDRETARWLLVRTRKVLDEGPSPNRRVAAFRLEDLALSCRALAALCPQRI